MLHEVIERSEIRIREILRYEISEWQTISTWCREETLRSRKILPKKMISLDIISSVDDMMTNQYYDEHIIDIRKYSLLEKCEQSIMWDRAKKRGYIEPQYPCISLITPSHRPEEILSSSYREVESSSYSSSVDIIDILSLEDRRYRTSDEMMHDPITK